ncbi:MAG: glycosyltransferase [Chloroflexota bacterium]|nr:MAG: glycosyltransferase family 4 protein [Chloroflexota bacterium]
MNILMLTSSYPKYPGETTAPFIEEIAAGLVRRGHSVTVLAPFHPELRRAPVERGVRLRFYRYAPHPALNVYGYAESLRADVGLRGRALAAVPLAATASLIGLLRLSSRRPRAGGRPADDGGAFDLLHAHWVLPNGVPAALAARLRGLPLVVSLHGSDVFMAAKAWPLSLAAAAVLRAAGAVTACSGDLYARALALGAPPERTEVIPYGVDVAAFRPDPQAVALARSELGLPEGAPLVLALGRLVYKKGFSYLLEAFPAVLAAHPEARLAIVGYGDLRDELERRAVELGLSGRVIFTGQLGREQAARAIAAADVYVVPSVRDQAGNVDGLPNTLLEGMSAARPIVASRVAGIPDVIADGVHGLLTPEKDPQALACAITRLLDDRALAQSLGERARRRVLEELTWDSTAARFEAAYERALISSSGSGRR